MAAKQKTISEYMPSLAERVERELLTRAKPRVTTQVGSSRFSTSKKGTGTASEIIEDEELGVGRRLFGSPDAVLDVTLEQAAKPNPNYAAARQANIGKKALAGFMDEYENDAAAREASESGRRTVERVQNQRKADSAPTPTASSTPAATRDTLPKVSDPMRSLRVTDSIAETADAARNAPAASSSTSTAVGGNKVDSATDYSARATAAFKKATGTSFDPKSKVDRARLKEIEDTIRSNPKLADASDTKISMAWYARAKKK
jgi:hypothetical protein